MTIAQLCAMIQEYAATNGTNRLPTAAVVGMVNLAQRWLARHYDWDFFEKRWQGTTMPYTWQHAQLPNDWLRPVNVYYLNPDTGLQTFLDFVDFTELEALYPLQPQNITINVPPDMDNPDGTRQVTVTAPVAGLPVLAAFWQRQIQIRPRFANGGSLMANYYGYLTDWTSENQGTSVFITQCWDAVLFTALAKFSTPYMMEDARMATWQDQMMKAIQTINTSQRATQGRGSRPIAKRYGRVYPAVEGVEE